AVREVKDEIKQLIDELKNLSTKNETLRIQNENADIKIRNLTEESKIWKTKYDNINVELRSFKRHQYIIEYQTAIDELMKTSRFSTELSNLLASAKYYAGGMGISPVSLVDAAAGNLTVTIVDLVKLLGMRPVHDTMQPTKNNNFAPTVNPNMNHHSMNHNMNHSTSPNMSYPTSPNMNHPMSPKMNHSMNNSMNNSMNPNQLSQFLKVETDHIGTFAGGEGLKYRNQGNIILSDLDRCNSKIVQIRDTDFAATPENANAVAKRNLAQESYEIAKYTKELINMLDM
ncbi:hypothetical protein BDF21DRAFT_400383, partial [Thamnidium elegans]